MNKTEIRNIVEEKVKRFRKLYLSKEYKLSSVKDLISHIFLNRPKTYYKTGNIHCHSGNIRSVSDGYKVVKAYFPKTTFKKYLKLLQELRGVEAGKCYEINKIVIFKNWPGSKFKSSDEESDFNNIPFNKILEAYE